MLHGSRGVVGHPELEGAQPCPGLPEACPPGGPLEPLVGHGSGRAKRSRVRVAPIRVASRPARSTQTAVGAGLYTQATRWYSESSLRGAQGRCPEDG